MERLLLLSDDDSRRSLCIVNNLRKIHSQVLSSRKFPVDQCFMYHVYSEVIHPQLERNNNKATQQQENSK